MHVINSMVWIVSYYYYLVSLAERPCVHAACVFIYWDAHTGIYTFKLLIRFCCIITTFNVRILVNYSVILVCIENDTVYQHKIFTGSLFPSPLPLPLSRLVKISMKVFVQ